MKRLSYPTRDELLSVFSYNPLTGVLIWKERSSSEFETERGYNIHVSRFARKEAGGVNVISGYHSVRYKNRLYFSHRLIWIMFGDEAHHDEIDHINGNRSDNRIMNLRGVTYSQNAKNKRMRSDNKSGVTGVYWSNYAKKWAARYGNDGKVCHVGYFKRKQDAAEAVLSARALVGFTSNHGEAA